MKCVLALLALAACATADPSLNYGLNLGLPLAAAPYGINAGLAAYGPSTLLPASALGLVSYPNGAVVPVDEPAVQAARAEHLASKPAIAYAAPAIGYGAPAINAPYW